MNGWHDGRWKQACRACGVLVVLCWLAAAMGADNATPPAKPDDMPAPQKATPFKLLATLDDSAGSADDQPKPEAVENGNAESLTTETEKPEDFEKIEAESPYPPTDSPDKLTLEQLEAIAKLAPKANQAGIQTHPAMVPLFRSMVLHYTGGSYKNSPIRFRLHVPEPYQEGQKYPMVVWLHGAGECGSDNIDQLSHLHHIIPYLTGPKKRDFFLLVPQCPHSHVSWEAPEICLTKILFNGAVECHINDDPVALGNAPVSFTLAMIEAVKKNFPVDPNRITVGGLSTGGEGVWRILERNPDLFAAAAPVVSWKAMEEKSLREKPLLKKIPIWAIYSSDDNGIDFARKEFERMREHGCHVFKTEFGVCGHRAWTPAMLQGDIFGWLISRAKEGDRYYAAGPSPTTPETIGIFADVTDGDLKRTPTEAVKPGIAVKESLREPRKQPRERPSPPRRESDRMPRSPMAGQADVEQFRIRLVVRYLQAGEIEKALALADKIQNRPALVNVLLNGDAVGFDNAVSAYVERELDRMEQSGEVLPVPPRRSDVDRPREEPLQPIPAGKKNPKDECGKEWAMSPTTLYGLFPNGWDQEAKYVPEYVVNETGKQLRDRLEKAFVGNDLPAMKELCESFLRLDDIPLSSPWFDVSGGRLQGRIQYTLNEKAKPVVELLREIAQVQAESKKEFVELAQKSLERIDAILHPKTEE